MAVTRFPGGEPVEESDLAPEFSDDALALEFTARHRDELRYVAKWGAWLHWDGMRWKFEETFRAFDLARAVARDFANACRDPSQKPKIASAGKVAAICTLARADRAHAATADIWDSDEWALNTPGGIVDLRTGDILAHDPSRHLTKITAVAPGDACPRWRKFLREITGGDAELEGFLQRIAGYSLSSSTREHALFFLYGTGGNGKGVFLNTLTSISATMPPSRRWKPSSPLMASGTRPIWPGRTARGSFPRKKPRKADIGQKIRSRR